MKKIAILYICTGRYTVFWKEFFESYQKHFLNNSQKHYYVFTDADRIEYETSEFVHKIFQKNLGWPDNTLLRFEMFWKIEDELKKYDYIFFMNANCMCMEDISEKDFLPSKGKLLVVRHPGFYNKTNMDFPYDRNEKSKAYIPYGEGEVYICGGVNGGCTSEYLTMIKELRDRINSDIKNGVVALWHDESHINKYIIDNANYILQEPEYCYPEGWEIPFTPKILVRDKSRYIDVDRVKLPITQRFRKYLSKLLTGVKMKRKGI